MLDIILGGDCIRRRGGVHTVFRWGNLRKTGHFQELVVDGRIILKWIFKKKGGEEWTGVIWLPIGTGGEPL